MKPGDTPAVICADGVLSRRELSERVQDCARRLDGVRGFLAIEVADGADAVVALLAARDAGVPFVWLDPGMPPHRRARVVSDCRPAALLTFDAGPTVSALPDAGPVPDGAACLVYTSGSTGSPKGIVQTGPNLDQFAGWFAAELGLAAGSRMLQWASMTYDAAYAEVLAATVAGATLVVPPAEVKADPERVAEWIAAHQVSHVLTVPSLFRHLAGPFPSVCSLSLFGETLRPAEVERAATHMPRARVTNFYGPTECTLATYYRVPPDFAADVVPVGIPVPGREIVLDSGEICVRSRYLALGYLNRDAETAERFLPDPRKEPGVRIYRTGDLGRLDDDGVLLFEGRQDDQVKIRGIRVQLAEIESVLRAQRGVADAAVRVLPGEPTALAAYLRPGDGLDTGVVHRAIARHLPPAMVPSHYVTLERFPRTPSGKLDRAGLPDPRRATADPSRPGSGASAGRAPATELERAVAGIWHEVIDHPDAGPRDDFFAVGGTSLLAPKIVHAVGDRLGVRIPLRAVFEHSRLGDFAAYLETMR